MSPRMSRVRGMSWTSVFLKTLDTARCKLATTFLTEQKLQLFSEKCSADRLCFQVKNQKNEKNKIGKISIQETS